MMMENYMGMKLKRKELEDFNDDFSDFSLSSPPLKIRRLDAELPPIIEEEEAEIQLADEQRMPEIAVSNPTSDQLNPLDIEELPFVPENEERAIVVFKPVNTLLSYSSSNYSIDPNLISSFKNQAFLGSHLNAFTSNEEDETMGTGCNTESNTCRAVIPWVPSQQLDQRFSAVFASQTEVSETMDAEEPETSTMDIEDAGASNVERRATEYIDHSRIDENSQQQWQQQQCMIPQPPQNTTTPIVCYRWGL